MYSKLIRFATFAAAVLISACSVRLPWSDEPIGQEINLVLVLQNNLLFLPSTEIDGRPGRFMVGSSQQATILDPRFAHGTSHSMQLNQRRSVPFSGVVADLHGVSDAIIGADVWGTQAVTIDYRAGLLTLQREGIHPELMTTYRFTDQPTITVSVDGRTIPAIIDTTSPDTLVLPAGATSRSTAHVKIAGTDFGTIGIRTGGVASARVGNRLLSKFLVSIDYRRRVVGLWRDPRTEL